jgi:hypothetical protein
MKGGGTQQFGQFAYGQDGLTIFTTFRLQSMVDGYQADLVLYRGGEYQCMSVDDWTAYGRGFVVAHVVSQPLREPMPVGSPQQ